MYICSGKKIHYIDDKYIDYSPFLKNMINTELNVEMVHVNGVDAFLIDEYDYELDQYIKFLQGEDFIMDENVHILFDYMGHHNEMQYPLDYWKIKLRDNWIRDNMYRLELYKENPYYGLKEIPIVNKVHFPLSNGIFIAGGAALYMTGGSSTYNDIDIFFTDKENAYRYMKSMCRTYRMRDNCISAIGSDMIMKVDPSTERKTIQMILRMYKSPSEIVHGFDVDCVGFIYDGNSLWGTERAIYALNNKVNWFDPKRSSPSYAYRLSKYSSRGYEIELPLLHSDMINQDVISKWEKDIENLFVKTAIAIFNDNYINGAIHIPEKNTDKEHIDYLISLLPDVFEYIDLIALCAADSCINQQYRMGSMIHFIKGTYEYWRKKEKFEMMIPRDPASILILSKIYKIYTSLWRKSDYENYTYIDINYDMKVDDVIKNIKWKEQNPMEQVTSTFYPDPINGYDLQEWYSQSPFYGPNINDITDMKEKPTINVTYHGDSNIYMANDATNVKLPHADINITYRH